MQVLSGDLRGESYRTHVTWPDYKTPANRPVLWGRLAALADGEGHFAIRRQKTQAQGARARTRRPYRYSCQFSVHMRDDDLPFLERMASETELGRVWRTKSRSALWVIYRFDDCVALTEILDAYPLWSKKARDYAIWREAMLARSPSPADWEARYERLRAVRAYSAPSPSLAVSPSPSREAGRPETEGEA